MKTQPRRPSRPPDFLPVSLQALAQQLRQAWRQLMGPAAVLAASAAAARSTRLREVLPDAEAEPPGACGWFDSSHELVHGLQVQELTTPESQAAALPLATWLQLQLEGCGSAQPA